MDKENTIKILNLEINKLINFYLCPVEHKILNSMEFKNGGFYIQHDVEYVNLFKDKIIDLVIINDTALSKYFIGYKSKNADFSYYASVSDLSQFEIFTNILNRIYMINLNLGTEWGQPHYSIGTGANKESNSRCINPNQALVIKEKHMLDSIMKKKNNSQNIIKI